MFVEGTKINNDVKGDFSLSRLPFISQLWNMSSILDAALFLWIIFSLTLITIHYSVWHSGYTSCSRLDISISDISSRWTLCAGAVWSCLRPVWVLKPVLLILFKGSGLVLVLNAFLVFHVQVLHKGRWVLKQDWPRPQLSIVAKTNIFKLSSIGLIFSIVTNLLPPYSPWYASTVQSLAPTQTQHNKM